MLPLIEHRKDALAALCRKFGVHRLDVFGSAATTAFDPITSDLDFVVLFADRSNYADRYLRFVEALEDLFQRPVDLLTERSIRNPYFRMAVEATRQRVYDQSAEKAAF